MLSLQAGAAEATMSSREIAELTNKRHDNVIRVCRDLKSSGVTPQIEECRVINELAGGREFIEYRLNKRDSHVLVARLSPEFTGRLVDRWMELEAAAPAAPDLSDPRALRGLLLQYSEKVIELDAKIAADAPKVAFAEAVRAIDGACHIEKIAKTLGIGRNKLFRRLRADGILLDNNLPYQKYIDREYFTVIEQQPYTDTKGVTHATFTTMVTGAGQVFLAKRYANIAGGAHA
jgi:phage antirepressor YoqD-like protein